MPSRKTIVSLLAAVLLSPHIASAEPATPLRVLSSPAWAITGGDALVEAPAVGRVMLNHQDVTTRFQPQRGVRLGLISGLREGRNTLEVSNGNGRAEIILINYPLAGPVFSGPHQTPFICETQSFKLPDGTTLGSSQEPDCFAPTNVQYLYKSTSDGQFKPYRSGETHADEVAATIIKGGAKVDYIVRLETGVVNRAIYQVAMLAKPSEQISPTSQSKGWNGRLIYAFGGNCGPAYRQGRETVGVVNHIDLGNDALDMGYAVATATLNTLGQNCNDVTSAETAMMVKERFIETFGAPAYTIGWGGSGGAMLQNLIVANYPGILDGIIPARSFADTLTTLVSAADCPLLHKYLENASGWTEAQKTAVVGFPSYQHCAKAWLSFVPRWHSPAASGCDATAFATQSSAATHTRKLFDPEKNPDGLRCGYFDNAATIWGQNPDGSARLPLDNTGVQYGLDAFNSGVISFEQFAELNRSVGSYDAAGTIVAQRAKADPTALHIAYATGRVNQGYGMDAVPILDLRHYLDKVSPADVHTMGNTLIARARWQSANGQADNFVSWTTTTLGALREDTNNPVSPYRVASRAAVAAMDNWLEAIASDHSKATAARKVVTNRPDGLEDACFDAKGMRHNLSSPEGKACIADMVPHKDPRTAAGEPPARVHLKCALAPINAKAYTQTLSREQVVRLAEIFPDGVCDYTQLPVGQVHPAGTWLSYAKPGSYQQLPLR